MSEQRAADRPAVDRDYLDARLDTINAHLDGLREHMDARFETVDSRFDGLREQMDARFGAVDARFEAVDARFDRLDSRIGTVVAELKVDLERRITLLMLGTMIPLLVAVFIAVAIRG